ncbi:MAG: hypothetical protein LBK66_11605 [Spirochaetaceae bacterium]|jgi:WD40 repeat protein|nr:hypothetical protein [Spirochaetaceae bacterium]
MTDYDFFDLTHLPFDPPEKAAQKVTGAVEKSKKELVAALSSATQQLERDEITGKQSFLDTIIKKGSKDSIISNDDKLTPAYSKLAEDKVKKEIEKLREVVLLLPSPKFTDGTIRRHSKRTLLSEGHVKEVFRNAGFTEIPRDELFNKHYPKFPKNADIAYKELEALRKPENKKWTDFTPAEDLYAFAACMAGEPEKTAEYKKKTTPELKALFDGFAGKLSGQHDNDPAGHLCSSLATYGKTYIFDTEDHRQAYEAYLKYKNPLLTQLFAQMKSFSSNKQDLLDPGLAEAFINKISAIFGCYYMVSVNIYNKEAGLQGELYIPAKKEELWRELRALKGHFFYVYSVAWSPDGLKIASGAGDDTVRIWDAENGRELHTLTGHHIVESVAWSPDGHRIASGSRDETVRIWDAESGRELHTLKGHTYDVLSVAWSPDGRRIASGSNDMTVRIWDVESGRELHTLKDSDYIYSVAWSPDGCRIASGSSDKTIKIWDAESGRELHTLKGHTYDVLSVAWSPDGRRIASGSNDKTVRIWGAE